MKRITTFLMSLLAICILSTTSVFATIEESSIIEGDMTGVVQSPDFDFSDTKMEYTYVPEDDNIIKYYNSNPMAAHYACEDDIISAINTYTEYIDISAYQIPETGTDNITDVFNGILNNNPNLFFVKGFRYTKNTTTNTIIKLYITYTSEDTSLMDSEREEYAVSLTKAVSYIKSQNPVTELEKAVLAHDYITQHVAYNHEGVAGGTCVRKDFTALGASRGVCVCQGYSLYYMDILEELEVPCSIVTSRVMQHAWNIIGINDNNYHVDCTYDDTSEDVLTSDSDERYRGEFLHSFSLMSDTELGLTHMNWTTNYSATDTSYDNLEWKSSEDTIVKFNNYWYYILEGTLYKTDSLLKAGTRVDSKKDYKTITYTPDRMYYTDGEYFGYFKPDGTSTKEAYYTGISTMCYMYDTDTIKVFHNGTNSSNTFIPLKDIIIDCESNMTLTAGDKVTVNATIIPSNATANTVFFTTDDIEKISCGIDGFTALKPGMATVTIGTLNIQKTINVTILPKTYYVTYNLDGGTNHPDNPASFEVQTLLKEPAKEDYKFLGWYDEHGTRVFDLRPEKDYNLTARWQKYRFSVTYISNNGTANITEKFEQPFAPTDAKRKGYRFLGWYENGVKINYVMADRDYTLTAKWKKISVKATKITKTKRKKVSKTYYQYTLTLKNAKADGYRIEVSTKKSMKGKKTYWVKKTTAKLKLKKGKTYYIRVRAYTTDSTKTKVYGKWSSIKKIKCK